jgi:two-component system response regulator MtrA
MSMSWTSGVGPRSADDWRSRIVGDEARLRASAPIGQTILVVEDDPAIRALMAATLACPGRRLVEVGEGSAALEAARGCRPDLVLLDVGLPGLDGFGVCEQLRRDPLTRGATILFVTARTAPVDRQRGLAAGADEYIEKPFSPSALRAVIERRLGPPPRE